MSSTAWPQKCCPASAASRPGSERLGEDTAEHGMIATLTRIFHSASAPSSACTHDAPSRPSVSERREYAMPSTRAGDASSPCRHSEQSFFHHRAWSSGDPFYVPCVDLCKQRLCRSLAMAPHTRTHVCLNCGKSVGRSRSRPQFAAARHDTTQRSRAGLQIIWP